jgi:hypothetical protein
VKSTEDSATLAPALIVLVVVVAFITNFTSPWVGSTPSPQLATNNIMLRNAAIGKLLSFLVTLVIIIVIYLWLNMVFTSIYDYETDDF